MDQFKTHSTSRKNIITIVLTAVVMFAAAFWGLTITVAAWLFFEGIILVVTVFCLLLTAKTYWILEFNADTLTLTNNGNRQQYLFRDLTLTDFQIKQSAAQKKQNTCDLRIADAPFQISDLQNYDAFCAYLQKHFQ